MDSIVPIHTFIIKVASRCNLNCTYCFVYNQPDKQWKNQPKLISEQTLQSTCEKIIEHLKFHSKKDVRIIFHGGEPLMGGLKHLNIIVSEIEKSFENTGISYQIGMQSNGLLINENILKYCLSKNISIGISIDGPPKINDINRIDHSGNGSSKRLEKN